MDHPLETLGSIASIAAIPLTGGASAALTPWIAGAEALGAGAGIVDSMGGQSAANRAYGASTTNQAGALGGEIGAANQLMQPISPKPLLDVQRGGVESFLGSAGGVPNIGALAKSLFGGAIEKALSAVLAQQSSNTATAGSLYGNAAAGYGNMATGARANAVGLAGSGAGPAQTLIDALKKIPGGKGGGKSGVVTGPGAPGGGDIGGLDRSSGPPGFGPDTFTMPSATEPLFSVGA